MKKLFLCALLMALPAWAGETAPIPPVNTQTSGYVQLQGAPKKVRSMVETLEQSDVFKAAGCEATPGNKSGSLAGMSCSQPNSALIDMLNRLAPHGVKWNMSVQGCAVGCTMMPCPPPSGKTTCCKQVSGVYKTC